MKSMSVYQYITASDPNSARDFLLKNGYGDVPKNYGHVAMLLADFVNMNGESGLKKLMSIHPEVVNEVLKISATGVKEPNGEFMNCSGCDLIKKMSADAGSVPQESKGISEKTTNTLIIAGSLVLASIILTVTIAAIVRN